MRTYKILGIALLSALPAFAQDNCPATVTVTQSVVAGGPETSTSSQSRQVVYQTSVIYITSNDVKVAKLITRALEVLSPLGTTAVRMKELDGCPEPITVTVVSESAGMVSATLPSTSISSSSSASDSTPSNSITFSSSLSSSTSVIGISSLSSSSSSSTPQVQASSSNASPSSTPAPESGASPSTSVPKVSPGDSSSSISGVSLASSLPFASLNFPPMTTSSTSAASFGLPSNQSSSSSLSGLSLSGRSSSSSSGGLSLLSGSSSSSLSGFSLSSGGGSSSFPGFSLSSAGSSSTVALSLTTPLSGVSTPSPSPAVSLPTATSPTTSYILTGPVTTTTGFPPTFWDLAEASRTIDCDFPCTVSIPCSLFGSTKTLDIPAYTTSVCRPECGDVQWRKMVTTTFSKITTTEMCFRDMILSEAGSITPMPYFGLGSTTMQMAVPSGWSTCVPHMPNADTQGKTCGPDNHYLCPKKQCCSKDGKCGTGNDFCGEGCQLNWGYCWKNSTSCTMPTFNDDGNQNSTIPIFPIWPADDDDTTYLKDKDFPPPPGFSVKFGSIKFPDMPDFDWPPCKIVGGCDLTKDIRCGWLACDFYVGWFTHAWQIVSGCDNPVKKILCALLKVGCCSKNGNDSDKPDCDFCDPPSGDDSVALDGEGKLCDPDMENCGDPPEPDDDDDCTSTSTVVDKTVYCALTTAQNKQSTQSCTSTKSETRSGCTLEPASSTTVTETACKTTRATQITQLCTVVTAAGATKTTCPSSIESVVQGCSVTDMTTSKFTTSCSTTTAPHITQSCDVITITGKPTTSCVTSTDMQTGCGVTASSTATTKSDCSTNVAPSVISTFGVATAANSTTTFFKSASTVDVTGCSVTFTAVSTLLTSCYSSGTVTDFSFACFTIGASGSALSASATCTRTKSSLISGCEVTGSTTSNISTSYLACAATGTAQISFSSWTMTSNMTSATRSSSCGPPTSSGLGACTKLVVGPITISEAFDSNVTSSDLARRDASTTAPATISVTTRGSISCWCGSTATQLDVWPQTVCGNYTWCPNEATTFYAASDSGYPPTLSSYVNATESSTSTSCVRPTSSGLPACTKIANGLVTISEASDLGAVNATTVDSSSVGSSTSASASASDNTTASVKKRQGSTKAAVTASAVTTGDVSCWCGSSVTQDVWPTICGNLTMCPNEPTTFAAVTGSVVIPTLSSA